MWSWLICILCMHTYDLCAELRRRPTHRRLAYLLWFHQVVPDSFDLYKDELLPVTEVNHIGIQNVVIVQVFKEIGLFVPGLDKFRSVIGLIFYIQQVGLITARSDQMERFLIHVYTYHDLEIIFFYMLLIEISEKFFFYFF